MPDPVDPEVTGAFPHDTNLPIAGERFAAGVLLIGRYRLVAALGKGGMGEVYRADDLTLGQSVALKFLPMDIALDPSRLARFHGEVRIARQVSSPHVCRVHDVGSVDGQPFLIMEYVDGEDLSSLLKRIGRLPEEKGIELARQLCLGLAAAHDRGVIHRDLKPANVMIDGRGQVRLTDFGLATAIGDAKDVTSGTPAYQAPEQLLGREVTVRSDLFSLGLVLYEVFTGRRAFPSISSSGARKNYAIAPPSKPSDHVSGLDAGVDEVILRCLEYEPSNRPRTAIEVLAALPGGDPLMAALNAGQTPSPEAVANAPIEGSLVLWVAAVMLFAILLGVYGVAKLNDSSNLFTQVPLRKARPSDMADKARELIKQFGYTDPPIGTAWGFQEDRIVLDRMGSAVERKANSIALTDFASPPLFFWYRQSTKHLVKTTGSALPGFFQFPGWVTPTDPPMTEPGMAAVVLDLKGQLLEFYAVPTRDDPGGTSPPPDSSVLFRASGLDAYDYRLAESNQRRPLVYADQRQAWKSNEADNPLAELSIEAAFCRDLPVYFFVGPRGDPDRFGRLQSRMPDVALIVISIIIASTWTGGSVLARQNWRRGRANAKGAFRLALYVFILMQFSWLLLATHTPGFFDEISIFGTQLGGTIFVCMEIWIWYLALEPYVRRRWPWMMVGWNRLLAGRWNDPMVGRDFLIGGLLGVVNTLIQQVLNLLPAWMGFAPNAPLSIREDLLGHGVCQLLIAQLAALFAAQGQFFILFVLVVVLRRPKIALIVALSIHVMLMILPGLIGSSNALGYHLIAIPIALVGMAMTYTVLLRFGFLAHFVGMLFVVLLNTSALTTDLSTWYANDGLVCASALSTVSIYAFYTCLGDRRFLTNRYLAEL